LGNLLCGCDDVIVRSVASITSLLRKAGHVVNSVCVSRCRNDDRARWVSLKDRNKKDGHRDLRDCSRREVYRVEGEKTAVRDLKTRLRLYNKTKTPLTKRPRKRPNRTDWLVGILVVFCGCFFGCVVGTMCVCRVEKKPTEEEGPMGGSGDGITWSAS